ncbi:MAG: hypothetical protein RIR79_772 [Pseudomonadota bacterium]|jgi:dinuclear metal center YbgI/SA1388 family protein
MKIPKNNRLAFQSTFDDLLQPHNFQDYALNGLQVEGRLAIKHIVSGVTANLALIEAAITHQADAILVHHGLFWRGQDMRIMGWMRQRLGLLLAHDINLFAYHLPLDDHAQFGNNAQLARLLGLQPTGRFGDQNLGWIGNANFANTHDLVHKVQTVLGRTVLVVGEASQQFDQSNQFNQSNPPIQRIAWCSGGAQKYLEAAIAAGAQAFITGEISEPQVHIARECGIAYLACGHHATERYGVQALGNHIATQFGIRHTFIEIENPV